MVVHTTRGEGVGRCSGNGRQWWRRDVVDGGGGGDFCWRRGEREEGEGEKGDDIVLRCH